ncbi:YraN family protein [Paenibacillus sp. HN-1]|uniref:YraN family protein n=1 Tax=Paenibacillus TaxID=44249 RepID=UPI001CA8BBCF|nr:MULTISPECIES: YraN family protein [Paenibacillus]MBY9081864.1 YraN family protein [Paenibacillus sp. CGMCC 1.18879]MBY9085978.1 YraN family protein [Paenibacillus sinensis]
MSNPGASRRSGDNHNGAAGETYTRRQKGQAAEEAAVLYLSSRGYTVLERNWRCRTGEIDIIAEKSGVLIFVEVRSRSGSGVLGTPEEAVDPRKREQVRRTAAVYLHLSRKDNRPVAFDAIAVRFYPDMSIDSLHHIPDAF